MHTVCFIPLFFTFLFSSSRLASCFLLNFFLVPLVYLSVIIFDEPTNHLDMESIDALVEAARDYRGGLVVVSHDEHFMTNICSELWTVGGGKVNRFRGNFDDYKKQTLELTEKRIEESVAINLRNEENIVYIKNRQVFCAPTFR